MAFCVGDAEALRNSNDLAGVVGKSRHGIGDFPLVMSGEIRLPFPVYSIAGNHDPLPAIDKDFTGGLNWGPNFHYLGRAGVKQFGSLRVGWCSGVYDARISTSGSFRRTSATTPEDRRYFTTSDVGKLMKGAKKGHIDLLLMHDWPHLPVANRQKNSARNQSEPGPHRGSHQTQAWSDTKRLSLHRGQVEARASRGNPIAQKVLEECRPSLATFGHNHHPWAGTVGRSQVVCLDRVSNGLPAVAAFEYDGDSFVDITPPHLDLPRYESITSSSPSATLSL